LIAILGTTHVKTLLDYHPQAAKVILRYGMACIGCDISRFHTIEEIAAVYHLEPTTLLEEIRQSTSSEELG
jgi:hybrid cluster-associated redox disulfide protein